MEKGAVRLLFSFPDQRLLCGMIIYKIFISYALSAGCQKLTYREKSAIIEAVNSYILFI